MRKKQRRRRSKKNDYIDNDFLYKKIVTWQETKDDKIYEELWFIFQKMCERNSTHYYYRGFTYKEDFMQTALIACIKGLSKFNAEKSNKAFNYFTTIITREFQIFIHKEKAETGKRDKCYHKYLDVAQDNVNETFKEECREQKVGGYNPDREYFGT